MGQHWYFWFFKVRLDKQISSWKASIPNPWPTGTILAGKVDVFPPSPSDYPQTGLYIDT